MNKNMKEAIVKYAKRTLKIHNWWSAAEIESFNKEHKAKYISKGVYFIPKGVKTDLTKVEDELGYALPCDIVDYIDFFWHPCVKGYYKIEECIILFSVIKYDDETDDAFLYHKNGLLNMVETWKESSGGDVKKYLPIGWTGYSGGYILYDLKTGMIYEEDFDNVGVPSEEPLAHSLKELISNLNVSKKEW